MERVELGDATLYQGDARDILPALGPLDALLTDPVWPNCPSGLLAGSDDPYGLWNATMDVLPAVRRMIVVLRTDCDPRFLATVPAALPFFRSILLPFVMPLYLGRALGGDEVAYWFGEPIARADGRILVPGRAPAAQPADRRPNGHPATRAQKHIDWLVDWSSDADDLVCDPFMGSGSTGIAACKLGRRFIGIEIERRFFDLACRRIDDAQRQGDLFIPRTPRSPGATSASAPNQSGIEPAEEPAS
jgi:site-specific DNA-methyltransferase (adenine-specific)